jgi:hypothetical protein
MGHEMLMLRQLPPGREKNGSKQYQDQGKIGDKGGVRAQESRAVKEGIHGFFFFRSLKSYNLWQDNDEKCLQTQVAAFSLEFYYRAIFIIIFAFVYSNCNSITHGMFPT